MGEEKHMVKTLVILILLFNGNVEKQTLHFNPPIDVMDCLALGDAYREVMSTHSWGEQYGAPTFKFDAMSQRMVFKRWKRHDSGTLLYK